MTHTTTSRPGKLARRSRGQVNHLRGLSAEDQVQRLYERTGARCLKRRWRGRGGEIDLIFERGEEVIFVEVKASKTHAAAAESLRPAQAARVCRAAEEFIGTRSTGSLTPMRIDVALVNDQGAIDVLENALMAA